MKMESPSYRCSMSPDEAREVILTWGLPESSKEERERMIFQGERVEKERYLLAVDVVRRSCDDDSSRRNSVIQIAMARLEDEFRNLLLTQASESEHSLESVTSGLSISGEGHDHDHDGENESSVHVELPLGLEEFSESVVSRRSSSGFSLRELDLVSAATADDLRSIAERMAACGFSAACVRAHGGARRSAVETTLRKLGIEKLTVGDVQKMEGHTLEKKIRRWIRAARVCFRVVFPAEKRLSDQVFAGITNMDETSFSDTVKPSALHLLTFAEAIGIVSHKSPERLFKVADLHDCLVDIIPEMELTFEWKSVQIIPAKAAEIVVRLGEAVRTILHEFETAVLNEPSLTPVPGGTIHPLTRYVMNYVSLISDYRETLNELIVLRPLTGSRYSEDPTLPELDLNDFEGKSPLELHLIWIIIVLGHNLETKSKHYRDPSLGHLFVMNNIHYIVQKATTSPELALMIGDGYLRRLTAKYRQAATGYHRSTWTGVLYCLREEGLHSSGSFSYSGVLKKVLKERFKAFNAMLDEVHRVQSTWIVSDAQLKEELRILILEHLVPAYRSYLGRYRGHIESGRHPDHYIKYSVEGLEALVSDLFEGPPSSHHARKKSY